MEGKEGEGREWGGKRREGERKEERNKNPPSDRSGYGSDDDGRSLWRTARADVL